MKGESKLVLYTREKSDYYKHCPTGNLKGEFIITHQL